MTKNSSTKINMGCGWRNFGPDWIHIDGGDYEHLDYRSITSLEFRDNTVDLIYASHVIEYFDSHDVKNLLTEWKRVLKKDGVLRVAVPNFEVITSLYLKNKYSLDYFLGPLYGRMEMGDEKIFHKTVYDFDSLKNLLEKCGFGNIVKSSFGNSQIEGISSLDTRPEVSLFVEAQKVEEMGPAKQFKKSTEDKAAFWKRCLKKILQLIQIR